MRRLLIVFSGGLFLVLAIYIWKIYPLYFYALYKNPYLPQLAHTVEPYLPQTSAAAFFDKVNQYRTANSLPVFKNDPFVCRGSDSSLCQNCGHISLLTITKFAPPNLLFSRILGDPTAKTLVDDPNLTHLCATTSAELLSLVFAREVPQVSSPPRPTLPPRHLVTAPTPVPVDITEDQLWQALSTYRADHKSSTLNLDDKLCTYSRKRVQDQITMMATTPQSAYPNQDKYPLDAHQGFAADAKSGYAFEVTGTTELAENLAYWPAATTAVQIIEWGWDSSTEGHRETQLSNDWTKACVTGKAGFFDAIFGK